jgi:hypothetical protein
MAGGLWHLMASWFCELVLFMLLVGIYWDENLLCGSPGNGIRLEFDNGHVHRIFLFGQGKTLVHAVDMTVSSTRV